MHKCHQNRCEEKFDDECELAVHSSYHEYHQRISELGRQELNVLEDRFDQHIKCPLAESLQGSYCFPQLPTRLICEWYDCREEFLEVEKFYQHVSGHAHRLLDKCYWNNCNKSLKTVTLQLMREHLRTHTLQKLYACPYCGNFFSTKIKFNDHFLRHIAEPEFISQTESKNIVEKRGDLNYDIEDYIVKEKIVKVFRCRVDNCRKTFLTSSLLREHSASHSSKSCCDKCPYVARSHSKLESHKLYRHQTDRNYECTICLKTFKQRGDLRAHVRRHQIVEPYKCDRCDFETLNEEGLNAHMKLHDRNYDYCCHICRRIFSRGNNLSRHLRDLHKLRLANGQSRFKYRLIDEGVYLLDTNDLYEPNHQMDQRQEAAPTAIERVDGAN